MTDLTQNQEGQNMPESTVCFSLTPETARCLEMCLIDNSEALGALVYALDGEEVSSLLDREYEASQELLEQFYAELESSEKGRRIAQKANIELGQYQ